MSECIVVSGRFEYYTLFAMEKTKFQEIGHMPLLHFKPLNRRHSLLRMEGSPNRRHNIDRKLFNRQ